MTYSELPPRASSHLAALQRYLDRQVRRFLGWRTSLTSNVRSSTSLEKNLKKESSTTSSHQKRSIFMLQPRTSLQISCNSISIWKRLLQEHQIYIFKHIAFISWKEASSGRQHYPPWQDKTCSIKIQSLSRKISSLFKKHQLLSIEPCVQPAENEMISQNRSIRRSQSNKRPNCRVQAERIKRLQPQR